MSLRLISDFSNCPGIFKVKAWISGCAARFAMAQEELNSPKASPAIPGGDYTDKFKCTTRPVGRAAKFQRLSCSAIKLTISACTAERSDPAGSVQTGSSFSSTKIASPAIVHTGIALKWQAGSICSTFRSPRWLDRPLRSKSVASIRSSRPPNPINSVDGARSV